MTMGPVSGNPEDVRFRQHTEAFQAAANRIFRQRRRMTVEDAITIVRMEFERRGIEAVDSYYESTGARLHRGPWWPLFHPRAARRER